MSSVPRRLFDLHDDERVSEVPSRGAMEGSTFKRTCKVAVPAAEAFTAASAGLPTIDYVDAEVSATSTGTALYVSPNGTNGAAGTESAPTTLASAISRITPGGTICLRGGTYTYSSTITIPVGTAGTAGARTTLSA